MRYPPDHYENVGIEVATVFITSIAGGGGNRPEIMEATETMLTTVLLSVALKDPREAAMLLDALTQRVTHRLTEIAQLRT